jgi:hypothetical protein
MDVHRLPGRLLVRRRDHCGFIARRVQPMG